MLEACRLPYQLLPVDINRENSLRRTPSHPPNKRMPAIVDHEPPGGGAALPVFESGAILLQLAEKTGQLLPAVQRWYDTLFQRPAVRRGQGMGK